MTGIIENLALDHLRHIRSRVDKLSDDMDDVEERLNSNSRQDRAFFSVNAAINYFCHEDRSGCLLPKSPF
ncbi:MAG: hypothetical protein ACRESZ_05245 [Methylococcales bacterium]